MRQLDLLRAEEAAAQEPGSLPARRAELVAQVDWGRSLLDRQRDRLRSEGYSVCISESVRFLSRTTGMGPEELVRSGRGKSLPKKLSKKLSSEGRPEYDACVQQQMLQRTFVDSAHKAHMAEEAEEKVYAAASRRWEEHARERRRAAWLTAGGAAVACALLALALRRRRRQPEAARAAALPAPPAAPVPMVEAAGCTLLKGAGSTPLGELFEARDRAAGPVLLMRLDALPPEEPVRTRCVEALDRALSLKHPNLAGQRLVLEGARVWLAVDGPFETLRRFLDAGRPDPAWALAALRHAAAGLDFLHARGLVHGGLMPETVLVGGDRIARLMASGLGPALRATAKGAAWRTPVGAPAYTAPEEELGTDRPESDVFSLGVVVYELASGTVPFTGPNFPAQKREKNYRPPGELAKGWPKALDAVVAKALDPEPSRRWRSCAELVAALGG